MTMSVTAPTGVQVMVVPIQLPPDPTNTGLATQFNWVIDAGSLVTLQIPILDSHNVPFDVTGWGIDAEIKTAPGGTLLYTWTSPDATDSGTNVDLRVPAAVSSAWTFAKGYYRVNIIHPTDLTQIYRILEGRLYVRPD